MAAVGVHLWPVLFGLGLSRIGVDGFSALLQRVTVLQRRGARDLALRCLRNARRQGEESHAQGNRYCGTRPAQGQGLAGISGEGL